MQSPRRAAFLALAGCLAALVLLAILLRGQEPPPAHGPAERSGAPPAAASAPSAAHPPPGLPIHVPATGPATPDELPASFEGRVVSSESGAGVGGAELTFSLGGAAASVRADPSGAFRFLPPGEGRWLLAAVTAPGFLPFAPEWGHSPVQLDAARGRHVRGIEIHLARAVELQGRVVDGDGKPVAGAEVRLLGAAAEAALVPIADRFTSGADGGFRFAAPEGSVLEARKEGYLPGRAEVDVLAAVNRRVTIELGPAHRSLGPPGPVEGRVVEKGGGPVAGALVTAAPERGFGTAGAPSAQAVTGADGRFAFPALDPGAYRVSARAEGRAPASARRVAPGTRDVLLELVAGGRLRGCVRDAASGAPVTPFTVLVFERRSALQLLPERTRSVIDPGGCYALDDLLPGAAAVVVSAPGHAPSTERAVEIPAPPAEAVADVALEPGGRLTGVVRDDATSTPLAGARISVEGALSGASTFPVLSEATTGPDGTFTLGGLPRRLSLYVAAAGHHARILGGLEVPPGGAAGPVEVRLRPTAPDEEPRVDLAGIGVVLAAQDEALAVVQVVAGGGAAEVGLRRGDLVLEVDGSPVADLGMTGAITAIRGPEGTIVTLLVRRGDTTFQAQVPRRMVRG